MRAVLTVSLAGAALLTSCTSDGLSVPDSYDNTVPETSDRETTTTEEAEEPADVPDTAAPTFTFPKPTIADTPAPAVTAPDVAATPTPDATPSPTAASTPAPASTSATASEAYTYVEVFDDTGLVSASIPSAWSDIDGTSRVSANGASAPTFEAAPDLDAYRNRWSTPGMRFTASAEIAGVDPETLIDELRPTDCDSDGSEPYDDGVFVGRMEVFTDCGGIGTSLYAIAATSDDGAAGVVVTVQAVTDADHAAFAEIQRTFNIHS